MTSQSTDSDINSLFLPLSPSLSLSLLSQGLACYIEEVFGSAECAQRGVVVGYDARYNSHRCVSTIRSEGERQLSKQNVLKGGKDLYMILAFIILSPLLFYFSALCCLFYLFSLLLLQICSVNSNRIPQQRIHGAFFF